MLINMAIVMLMWETLLTIGFATLYFVRLSNRFLVDNSNNNQSEQILSKFCFQLFWDFKIFHWRFLLFYQSIHFALLISLLTLHGWNRFFVSGLNVLKLDHNFRYSGADLGEGCRVCARNPSQVDFVPLFWR